MNICANKNCGTVFLPRTHNQKYCSSECCKIVTNARIMEKYYEKRDRKAGKERLCKECGQKLSRYNEDNVCAPCAASKAKKDRKRLLELVGM